jgi:hypothetical protein
MANEMSLREIEFRSHVRRQARENVSIPFKEVEPHKDHIMFSGPRVLIKLIDQILSF